MSYPLVRELAAVGIPVRLTCGVLGFSPRRSTSGGRVRSATATGMTRNLTNAIVDMHADDPEFGYRFIADELEACRVSVGERSVWRLCGQQRLWSTTTKKGRKRQR